MRPALRPAVLLAALASAACAARARPYRFAAPMVAGAELPEDIWSGREPEPEPEPDHGSVPVPAPAPAPVPGPDLHAHVDLAALPSPHRAPRPHKGAPADALAALSTAAPLAPTALYSLAGARDGRDPLAFALDLRARLDGDRWDVADGPALVDAARTRDLLAAPTAPIRAGALLVFDRAVLRAPASLVAIAIAVDDRGVATMLFLAAGVVRVGYVDAAHPAQKRDPDGRVRNTFLRHREEEPPAGTHFLAGELLAAVITPSRPPAAR